MPTVHCSVCRQPRDIPPSHLARLKDASRVTCSTACRRQARQGSKNWNWKGGKKRVNGYVAVWVPPIEREPGASSQYQYLHIQKVEQRLGRRLRPNERVRHKNGRKTDNRSSNLVVTRIRVRQTSAKRRLRSASADV